MNIIVAMSNNSGLTNSQVGDVVFYNSSNASTRMLFGTGQGNLPSMILSSNNMAIQGNLTMNNSIAVNGLYINMSNGLSANMTTSSVAGFSNTSTGVQISMSSNTSNNMIVFKGSNTTLASITGNANLYLGSNVGVGNSNYPTDPSGNTGNIITSGNICAGNLGMFRNRIINGNFIIDQRATATTAVTTGYGPDRWSFNPGSGASFAQYKMTSANDLVIMKLGYLNGCVINQGANTASSEISQYIELGNCFDLHINTITVSFWARTTVTGQIYVKLFASSDGGNANGAWSSAYNVNTSTTWQYYTVQIPNVLSSPSTGTAQNGYGIRLVLGTSGLSASAKTYCTGVQLEKGTIATPFEFRPYQIELQLCQRYYQILKSTDYLCIGSGCVYTSDNVKLYYQYNTSMRAPPTFSRSSGPNLWVYAANQGNGGQAQSFTGGSIGMAGTNNCIISLTGCSIAMTPGSAATGFMYAGYYIDFSAEL